MSRVVVVGLGKFGRSVAEALTAAGRDVLGVDASLAVVEACADTVAIAVQADATDPESLEAVGACHATTAVMAIGDDFEAAVLATSVLRELGIERIVARASSAREERILRLVGASDVLYIEHEMGRRLAERLTQGK